MRDAGRLESRPADEEVRAVFIYAAPSIRRLVHRHISQAVNRSKQLRRQCVIGVQKRYFPPFVFDRDVAIAMKECRPDSSARLARWTTAPFHANGPCRL